jgi:hypothetical protein
MRKKSQSCALQAVRSQIKPSQTQTSRQDLSRKIERVPKTFNNDTGSSSGHCLQMTVHDRETRTRHPRTRTDLYIRRSSHPSTSQHKERAGSVSLARPDVNKLSISALCM